MKINPWLIAASVMLATFMEVLDTSVAAVALPYMAGSLASSADESTWVLTSYLVSNAIMLPATGWLATRFGRKRLLLTCIVIFTASSFACGAALSLPMLILARVAQGAGGGALQPVAQAILMESFPPERQGMAMAVYGLGVVVAPILGPTLGGYITDNYSWRWIFFINIPFGILAIMMILAFVQDPAYIRNARPGRLDVIGLGLLSLWVGTLQIVLDKGQEADWFGALWIRWFTAVCVVAFVAFLIRELRASAPLVDLRIFTNRNFGAGTALIGMMGVILYALVALQPQFLQMLMGYDALQAGLAVSTRGIGAVIAMAMIGRLTQWVDNRALIAGGFVMLAFATLMFGDIDLSIARSTLDTANILSGMSIGFLFVPISVVALGTLRPERIGGATGVFNLVRNLGGSIGISVATALVTRGAQAHQALLAGRLASDQPAYRHFLAGQEALLAPGLGSATAARQAVARAYAVLVQQATLFAYVDTFRWLALLCLLSVPLALLLRRVTRGRGPVAAH
ncbi:MAG TPA: DHA2 family efflux MFS transporter permease subunit [Methylomirabilota bacterium]